MWNLRPRNSQHANSTFLKDEAPARTIDASVKESSGGNQLLASATPRDDTRLSHLAYSKAELYKQYMIRKKEQRPVAMDYLSSVLLAAAKQSSLKEYILGKSADFGKHFEHVFFSFIFSAKNELLGEKYSPLFIENLCSSPFIGDFQAALLTFFETKSSDATSRKNYASKAPLDLKLNFKGGRAGRERRCSVSTESYQEDGEDKLGIIVNGGQGVGKSSSIQAFINTFDFEVESIDLSSTEKIKEAISKYAMAVTMSDVKISLNNMEGLGTRQQESKGSCLNKRPDSSQTKTAKANSRKAKADISVGAISNLVDHNRLKNNSEPLKSSHSIESFFRPKSIKSQPQQQISPSQNETPNSATDSRGNSKTDEQSQAKRASRLPTQKLDKPDCANSANPPSLRIDPFNDKSSTGKKEPSINPLEAYQPFLFDEDSKNFSMNKSLYWNTRKIYLCKNLEVLFESEFVEDPARCSKRMEELFTFLEKSNYPFVFVLNDCYNGLFNDALDRFHVVKKEAYPSDEVDLLLYFILFFEANFKAFEDQRAFYREGQALDPETTYQSVYLQEISRFEEMLAPLALTLPVIQKIKYVNFLLKYDLTKIFCFIETNGGFFTTQETLHRLPPPAPKYDDKVPFFVYNKEIYFGHKANGGCVSSNGPDDKETKETSATRRLKKISKSKSKGNKFGTATNKETLGDDVANKVAEDSSFLKIDPLFELSISSQPALLQDSSLTSAFFDLLESALSPTPALLGMQEDRDHNATALKRLLAHSNFLINIDKAAQSQARLEDQDLAPYHTQYAPFAISKQKEFIDRISAHLKNKRSQYQQLSEDLGVSRPLALFEIEKLKIFANRQDGLFNSHLMTRLQKREMRKALHSDPSKKIFLIERFTADPEHQRLLRGNFPY